MTNEQAVEAYTAAERLGQAAKMAKEQVHALDECASLRDCTRLRVLAGQIAGNARKIDDFARERHNELSKE